MVWLYLFPLIAWPLVFIDTATSSSPPSSFINVDDDIIDLKTTTLNPLSSPSEISSSPTLYPTLRHHHRSARRCYAFIPPAAASACSVFESIKARRFETGHFFTTIVIITTATTTTMSFTNMVQH